MVLCAIGSMVVSVIASILAALTATSLCFTLRKRIFDKVSGFSPEDVGRFSIESLITRCSNDVTQVQNFVAQALQVLVKTPIISVWCVLKISSSEWEWTAVSVAGIVILAVVIFIVISSSRPFFKKVPVITDKINHSALEHLTGIRVVRAYNAESFQESKFEDASIEMMHNSISLWKRSSLLIPISSGTSNFLTLAIYWMGMMLIAANTGDPHNLVLFSDMIVFSSYIVLVIGNFMALSFMVQFSSRALASSKRVQEVIEYEYGIADGTFTGDGPEPGTVEFRNVSFTYPGTSSEVLHDISFKVEKGRSLAIIGATGSGKSTIADLVMRSYKATDGTLLVDGVDVREYEGSNLYSKIGFVPQTNMIFTGTVESNVNFGATRSARTPEDVRRALEIAQAAEFVYAMPDGVDSEVTEGGSNLSGGQKQRLSIARAICKDAGILVMDDPFSALDFATDRRLRTALDERCSNTTRILITQRVGTAQDADEIIVLDEGRIIGRGKHDWLLDNCPLYREFAVAQMAEGTV